MIPLYGHAGNKIESDKTLNVLSGYSPRASLAWVSKGEHKNSYSLFKKAMESVTDFKWLSRGDRVLLKIALNSGNEFPATTDPWALHCMVKFLKEKGAGKVIVGDQSGIQSVHWTGDKKKGSSRKCCASAGLLKVIDESEAEEYFFEERGYDYYIETSPRGTNHWGKPILVTKVLDEVDHIIYMPRVSSHLMGDITSGFKLSVGFLREDSRVLFHQGGMNFNSMYEEINEVPEIRNKLRLIMSSGRKVLSNFGPDTGHISEPGMGLIFASTDLLAHELVAYSWLQWNREYETPIYSHATTGNFQKIGNIGNKFFVWWSWDSDFRKDSTADIPDYEPGDIKEHPSIINRIKRIGGYPETIALTEINKNPDGSVIKYINDSIVTVKQ